MSERTACLMNSGSSLLSGKLCISSSHTPPSAPTGVVTVTQGSFAERGKARDAMASEWV